SKRGQYINLVTLIDDVITLYREEARNKNILLSFQSNLDEALILGSEAEVYHMIDLLIRNGITQTLEGFVKVTLDVDNTYFVATISDSGLGIHPDKNYQIAHTDFKGRPCRVMHIQDSSTRLESIREMVQAHHGRLDIQIEPGIGAARRLWLPKF
ncbi:MAG: ATP-binding protein, partial [Chloroflexota bacterium]